MPALQAPDADGQEGAHTPVWFEAGYWWPCTDEFLAAANMAPPRHDGAGLPARRGGVTEWTFTLDGLRLESEMNLREHWQKRRSRKTKQQTAVALAMRADPALRLWAKETALSGAHITITRVSPGTRMDSDNMAISGKHVRDAVARELGIDDGDRRLSWEVVPAKGPWATKIRIASS